MSTNPTEHITDDNWRDVANNLFLDQCATASTFFAAFAKSRHWADDDIDYVPAMCDTLQFLQGCAYDAYDIGIFKNWLTLSYDNESGVNAFMEHLGVMPLNASALDAWCDSLIPYRQD